MERPPHPPKLSSLPASQQADAAIQLYGTTANELGECLKTRDQLIDWIRRN
jgi:hypothetical protein